MDLSAYRQIQQKNLTDEQLKKDIEYAKRIDESGLKAPNKIPVVNQSQSNNPPSVSKQTGSGANAVGMASANLGAGVAKKQTIPVSQRQFGIGMRQTQAQPLPYAKKVAQTLPRVEPQVLQKAQQIGRQAQGKTQEQIRQQNLANIKRVGDEAAYDTTEKLQNLFEKPVKPKSVLGANAWAGLGQFNKGLAQTADFILPDVITPKAVQQGLDYYKKTEDAQAQHAANVNKEQGVSDTVGGLIQGTVAAIPNAILAMISGGTSLGAQTIGQTSTGFIGSVGNAVKELAKNPMFYSSLAQTAGSEYEQAKANGATELEATISAIISSIVNSGIEIGGGIEAIAKNPISLKNWVKGMLDEGKEEVLQGIISQAAAKATYDKDKQWVSATDENAVINPGRMAQEFAGGAVVGGILGGGQMLAGKALGMPTEQDSYLPQRGENATAADRTGRLGMNHFSQNDVMQPTTSPVESVSEQGQQVTPTASESAQNRAVQAENAPLSLARQYAGQNISNSQATEILNDPESIKEMTDAGVDLRGTSSQRRKAVKDYVQGIVNDTQDGYNNTWKSLNDLDIDTASWEEINNSPEIIAARKRADSGPPTNENNSPERKALRNRVQDNLYSMGSFTRKVGDEEIFDGPVKQERKAYIVIGPPAAGKSSVFANPLSKENSARIIDSDMAKKQLLPEFDDGFGAGRVHEESSDIADRLFAQAVANGDNIVYPLVGKNADKIRTLKDFLKSEGYTVELYLNELPAEKAARRAVIRFMKENRLVDINYVLSVGNKPSRTYDILREEGGFDRYVRKSNDVAYGQQPILVEDYTPGEGLLRLVGDRGQAHRPHYRAAEKQSIQKEVINTEPGSGFSMPETQRVPYAPGFNPDSQAAPQQLPRAEQTQPQQLPYAPDYNASNSPVQPTLPRAEELNSERQKNAQKPNLPYDATLPTAGEVNARQQEDFESFWFGHPELSEQDAMRLYEEQQRKSPAEKPVSPVSSDSGKMPQRERRQAWNYADKVKNEFDLDIDDKSLRGDIESLFSDVRKTGWTAENEARLQELSKRMVEKSNGVLNEAESRPARDAKRFIRGTKLYITPSIKAEIEHNHGNYNAFRKKHMGKLDMKLVDSEAHPGQIIDSYYTELSDIAPEWFPAKDADMNDKDMLEQIIWFVDEDTDVYDHPFEADPEGAAEFIAGRIKEGYTDLFTNQDVDIEKAKQAFAMEVNAKKALEATEKKAALSSDEKEIVSAMLKGQINPASVTDERLLGVYEARMEKYAAQRESRAAKRKLRSRYKELAQDFAEYASGWKDKVRGWFFDMETAERNIRDVIPDKELAERFIEQYITPLHTNEAEATRLKNDLRERLKKLNLGTKAVHRITPEGGKSGLYSESAIVQMYGEGLVNEQQVKMSGADVDKVKNAVSEFRQVYDQLLDMANEVLVANGYAPVEKRANYFPHWQEPEPTGVRKFLAKMGMKILGDDLPTDIAGITDTFRPGKKFVANYLRRQGNQTEYDALKGFDIYIDSVADVIFHTDDIQRLRALETEIRYQASDSGVQSRVRDIMEDPYLDEDAKSEAVRKILEEDRTSLSHFVNWLRKYTDTLAGKKNFSDRDWEYKVGRDLYETMKAVEGRISANMVGGNISSAMTNLIPIFQGTGEVRAKYMAQAMKDVARSVIRDDGFAERSDFLTNRLGSDKLMKTGLEKATSVASKPFELVDRFASETLTRAKYMQNVDAGMDADAAMADADAWAASLMADRSKGAVPLVFTEKNPVTKAFTMFQLEVNNQFRYMMKDLPRNMQDQGKAAIVGALMKIFIATGLYGELFKGLAGYDPTFNPLSLLRELIEGLSDEEKKKSEVITDFAVDAAKEIPFVGNVLGGGRLPVSNVSEGIKETANALLKYGTGEQSGKAFLNTLGNSAGSTAAMLLLPMGGNQLKKTAQGLTAVARGKVTTTDNEGNEKIKYLVDQTPGNAVRGALFGQWSFPEAREYVEGGFKMTNAKASDVINRSEAEAGIPAKTAMSVYKSMAGLGTKAYKLDKIFSDETLTPNQMAWLERELLNDGKPGMADQAIAAGVSPKLFYDVVTGANQDNKGGTSQTETLKELVRRNDLTNNQKGDIYYQMASDSQQGKMNKAKQNGISHAQWYQYMVKADSNRNGSVTRDEAKAALDSMNLSIEKKAYIWKLEGWSDKTNPYNK